MSTQLKWGVIFLFAILFISYKEYSLKDYNAYQKPPPIYREFNTSVFTSFLKPPKTDSSVAYLWGLQKTNKEINKDLLDENKTNGQTKSKEPAITKTKNALCIEKSCYRLLGFYKQSKDYVSFFNKDMQPHIKTITQGENLNNRIELESINKNTITLSEINTTRKWKFTLFDVNITKYTPKKETR